MKIAFLVGSYVPHQLASINSLIDNYDCEILSYSISEKFKFIPEKKDNFHPVLFKEKAKEVIFQEIIDFDPTLLVVAGWMIKDYVWLAKKIKKNTDIRIVAMSDTPFYGTLKQKINTIVSPFHLKKAFHYLWVSGIRQYDYARKLGFENSRIVFNSLSADNKLFYKVSIENKVNNYPKNFTYIGRFSEEKGLQFLVKAWNAINEKKGWTLTLIGDGTLKSSLQQYEDIIVKDYMPQDSLLKELENTGCFVLPSLHEPWALVIHEAACAGVPIICTEECGAAPHFVINKYNGYQVKKADYRDLAEKMSQIMNLMSSDLIEMSYNSRILSNSINPEITAASLVSIV